MTVSNPFFTNPVLLSSSKVLVIVFEPEVLVLDSIMLSTFLKHFSDCLFSFCPTCADNITGVYICRWYGTVRQRVTQKARSIRHSTCARVLAARQAVRNTVRSTRASQSTSASTRPATLSGRSPSSRCSSTTDSKPMSITMNAKRLLTYHVYNDNSRDVSITLIGGDRCVCLGQQQMNYPFSSLPLSSSLSLLPLPSLHCRSWDSILYGLLPQYPQWDSNCCHCRMGVAAYEYTSCEYEYEQQAASKQADFISIENNTQ